MLDNDIAAGLLPWATNTTSPVPLPCVQLAVVPVVVVFVKLILLACMVGTGAWIVTVAGLFVPVLVRYSGFPFWSGL